MGGSLVISRTTSRVSPLPFLLLLLLLLLRRFSIIIYYYWEEIVRVL